MPSDLQDAPKLQVPSNDDSDAAALDPYAEAAQALEQAQRVLSAARGTPRPPTILVTVAEKQFDALRAEIAALKASSERNLEAMDSLRKRVEDISKARDAAQVDALGKSREVESLKETHERERTELHAQMEALNTQLEALHSSNTKDRESLGKEREALAVDRARLETDRSTFEAARDTAHKAFLDNRTVTYIAQYLYHMIQIIHPHPFPAAVAEPVTAGSANASPLPSPPMTPRTATGPPFPLPSRRRSECDTEATESPPPKRAKTESPPTVQRLLAGLQRRRPACLGPLPPIPLRRRRRSSSRRRPGAAARTPPPSRCAQRQRRPPRPRTVRAATPSRPACGRRRRRHPLPRRIRGALTALLLCCLSYFVVLVVFFFGWVMC
ncbi:hypothetical protein FB451DRAFT_1255689 [Mycena latifolia]|nr:hypothetical protein FB451DRAFT_1255689 [Mycena latifolia]